MLKGIRLTRILSGPIGDDTRLLGGPGVRATRAGARVAIGDLELEAAQAAAVAIGRGATGVALDVTDGDAFAAFLDAAEESHGPLEVMVNDAGVDGMGYR